MGAAAVCCVQRETEIKAEPRGSSRSSLGRRSSWESVPEPDDLLAFFDCVESREAPQDPTLARTGTDELRQRASWHVVRKGGEAAEARPPPSVEADPREAVDEATVGRVAARARELWLGRIRSGALDEELAERVRQGFGELDEWTAPATARRMLRARCGSEDEAVEILDKAIACRLRRRALFQTMRCPVTCDARVIGLDLHQRPVVYICCSSQTTALLEMLPQLFLCFEAAVRIGHPEGQLVLIADMTGLKIGPNADRAALRELSESFGTVFADRLSLIVIVDFSLVAQALWSLCQPFLSERTRSKIRFVNEEEARSLCKERLAKATCDRVLSAFDINRDATSTVADREAHAKRTSVCDVPLGAPSVNEAG